MSINPPIASNPKRSPYNWIKLLILLSGNFLSLEGFGQQPQSPLVKSFQEHLKLKEESIFGLNWIPLGPVSNSALVESFQVDLQHPGTIYLGFGSGSLWKTTNNGLSWKPIFDNEASYGIGDIALAPSNTNIIYLGTGETLKKPRNFTMPGTGMYRSDDGGETWRHLGLDDSWHIGKVVVHPTNPDIVYVSVLGHLWTTNPHRGVYRSLNGGKDWEHVLYVNERTGANDIVIAPTDPNTIYASVWESYPTVNGKSSGIFKSVDAGKTWKRQDSGIPEGDGRGRIGLAVSYQNPDKVYALMDHRNKSTSDSDEIGAAEVYLTLDGAKSWKRTHTEELMINSVIGWYFADIVVDAHNDDEIYALGVRLAHSRDGGKSFDLVAGDVYHLFPNPADPLHLDQCELWINPTNSNHLTLANDGGLYVSYDKGQSWMHFNNIPTGEFYDITLDKGTPYKIYGGTQDNATIVGHSTEWNPKRYDGWKYLWIDPWSGGDGCITVIDPVDSTTIYYSAQEGAIRRMDLKSGNSTPLRPDAGKLGLELNYHFISPYFLSEFNHQELYLGGNYILKSENRGEIWKAISPDLSKNGNPSKTSLAIGALAESPLKKGLIYAGTDKGLLWTTSDDGTTWIDRSMGLPDAYVRSITPSKYNPERVYLAMSGINYDDFNTYLFKSEDQGKTWESLTSNLPGEVAYVIKEDPVFENILYAGLYRAVYISTDRGKSWSQLGQGFPPAAVSDIEVEPRTSDLIVSTHGRGIYKVNLKPLYEIVSKNSLDQEMLFELSNVTVLPANRFDKLHNIDLEKMTISFWLPKARTIVLRIVNEKNEMIWSKEIMGRMGLNQYRWDLILKENTSPLPYFLNQKEFLSKGKYTLQFVGETTIERGFEAKD
ncbi:hypothetical protein D0X99_17785 [Algoriphagus lacus]|uniref:Sortilin N-terminal domain-containing protein n=1 Tax=Algoriphagus lacus TaxID=2056311 RepID=A0A418PNB2_9BACT|nr:exo-alpha-sialidase [Algoriphagus lacus]RIW12945.1 hypothetical protein D0X99_17785 [Algoriphagus lacus]